MARFHEVDVSYTSARFAHLVFSGYLARCYKLGVLQCTARFSSMVVILVLARNSPLGDFFIMAR